MDYEINKETLAIMPKSEEECKALENDMEYDLNMPTLSVIERSCEYFGSTYEGRRNGAKEILGAEYKVPIVVEDSNNLIIFPTTSPLSNDCAWISLKRVKNIEKIDQNNTKIIFDNEKEIIVNCSFRTIENQLSRAARLDIILRNHKNS